MWRKTRRSKRALLASVILAVTGMLVGSPAAWAMLVKAADWQMKEASGQMIDSSTNNNDGSPTDVLRTGSTYTFNGSTSRVAVPDSDSLDPLEKDITLTASVQVTNAPMDDSYDIVRKGLSASPGGDYKMEIKRASNSTVAKLHCLFKGSGGQSEQGGSARHRRREMAHARVRKDEHFGGGEGGREVLHAGGFGRLGLQPPRRPGWSPNDGPPRPPFLGLHGIREHPHRFRQNASRDNS